MNTKKRIIWLIAALSLALACVSAIAIALVYQSTRSEAGLSTVDVAQAVAETVAALPDTPTDIPAPTQSITPSPTKTRRPTSTLANTSTPISSRTPFPSRTALPSTTATQISGNPKDALGTPTWEDNFKDAGNWALLDDDCFTTEIIEGKYRMTSKHVPSSACWVVSWPRIQNYYLEVTTRMPGECSGKDRAGLYFRAPDLKNGYFFGLTCAGEYWLSKWDGELKVSEFLVEFTSSEYITAGPGRANVLGVLANNDHISLYINGKRAAEVVDDTYADAGLIGLFIGAQETASFSIEFDNLAYWDLPAQ
ncbi:MAG: hypothetical protein KKD28_11250 [Chloroflexi bacterium]|nr:hypothetical protein [Chloroflexota bacterium]